MAYSFLNETNVFKRYTDAKDYTDKLTEPFPEFSRIARNKPVDNLGNYPRVTDGTTAGIIQKTPKNAVQQLPTGLIETDDDNDWLPIVAQFIYTNKILPYANEDYGLFEKSHLVMEGGLTFGAQATFTRFAKHRDTFSPDVELIYWGDLAIQKGKKSGPACDYVFYRTWWQKSDIENLIDSESKLAKQAKDRGEAYEATWDVSALKEILDTSGQKDRQAKTPTEEERSADASGVELVTGFQKGVGAKFFTFHPGLKTIVRTKVNKDPRGEMPINWFYGDIDGTNPLGRGIPEMIGGLQNLIDARMQMQQYGDTMALAPPVIEYGNASDSFEFMPNKVVHSDDPNYKIDPVKINNVSPQDFIATQGYLQSQLYQLVAAPHSNISSSNAVVTDGKTPTALNQQAATLDIDINAVRKHFESWFEAWSESAINLYFAERSGIEILQLDDETADSLRKLAPTEEFDPNQALNDKNELVINYDTATPALKFRVDASTSKMQDNANQLKAFELISDFIENNQQIAAIVPLDKQIAIYNSVVSLAGVEDPEKLRITDEEQQQMVDAQAAAQAQQMPQAAQPMPQIADDNMLEQIANEYRQLDIPEDQIAQAIQVYKQQQGAMNV